MKRKAFSDLSWSVPATLSVIQNFPFSTGSSHYPACWEKWQVGKSKCLKLPSPGSLDCSHRIWLPLFLLCPSRSSPACSTPVKQPCHVRESIIPGWRLILIGKCWAPQRIIYSVFQAKPDKPLPPDPPYRCTIFFLSLGAGSSRNFTYYWNQTPLIGLVAPDSPNVFRHFFKTQTIVWLPVSRLMPATVYPTPASPIFFRTIQTNTDGLLTDRTITNVMVAGGLCTTATQNHIQVILPWSRKWLLFIT